jgi:hypothetical protein
MRYYEIADLSGYILSDAKVTDHPKQIEEIRIDNVAGDALRRLIKKPDTKTPGLR